MNDYVKVYVIDYGRKYLVLQWNDPITGKRRSESSKCTNKRQAHAKAREKEEQLNSGTIAADGKLDWDSFRGKLTDEVLSGVAPRTAEKFESVLNVMEKFDKPQTIGNVTGQYLSEYAGWLRKSSRSESTIKSHMRHLSALLRWAVKSQILPALPAIPPTPRASKRKMMRGRPITDAEFVKFLGVIPKCVDPQHVANWTFMARGLWLSGLRLRESLSLSWDQTTGFHVLIDSDQRIKFRIPAWAEKGHEDRIYPTTPDLAEFLLSVPEPDRTGFVFNPSYTNHRNGRLERFKNSTDVSRVFSFVGETAGIVVDERSKKFASAQDFRRSFGTRWAGLGSPSFLLKELMRHSSISTTELYYLDQDADRTQDAVYKLWNRSRDDPRTGQHNTGHNTDSQGKPENAEN